MTIKLNKDLKFDRYGDISFLGNDLETLSSYRDMIYQNTIDRLITNFADYELDRDIGADISSLIGKDATKSEPLVAKKITNSLIRDGFLDTSDFRILTFVAAEKILIKLEIFNNSNHFIGERIVVNSIFNSSSGLLYVTS